MEANWLTGSRKENDWTRAGVSNTRLKLCTFTTFPNNKNLPCGYLYYTKLMK